jgi:hypothetical protein
MDSENYTNNAMLPTSSISGKLSRLSSGDVSSGTAIASTLSGKSFAGSKRKRVIDLPVKPVSSYSAGLVPVFDGSPWNSYKKHLRLELGGSVEVVYRVPATKELFTIRIISGSGVEEKLFMIRQLRHENLLSSHELYSFDYKFFIVSELTAISLEELTVARPDEVQLAAIISQVRYGPLS